MGNQGKSFAVASVFSCAVSARMKMEIIIEGSGKAKRRVESTIKVEHNVPTRVSISHGVKHFHA